MRPVRDPRVDTRVFSPVRRRWLRGIGLVLLAALAALGADIAWRTQRWHAQLEGVRFVDHPEKVSGDTAAMTVTGYLVATVASDVDFFRLAREENAYPEVQAALCDSDKPLDAWRDPLPREVRGGAQPFRYQILVPMRARAADLSTAGEDVCLRFRATAVHPLSWIESRPVVVPLSASLRAELAAYAHRDGVVQLALDPACAPQLCEPRFPAAELGR